jgi:chemotaxis protein CheD
MTLTIAPPQPRTAFRGERRTLYLQAGQLVAIAQPAVITTILGSCVAVCLWDERLAIGGMNHFMLPFVTAKQNASPRFGTVAWETLLAELTSLGAQPRNLRAGVFGGACVMEAFRASADHVGARNVELAESQIAAAGITIVESAVGGTRGRKLIFETDRGRMTVKEL